MSLNRKQRRASAKKAKKSSCQLQEAGGQIDAALKALQKIEGLEGTAETLEGLGDKVNAALCAMEAVARDVLTLGSELEIQREVNLRLLSRLYANPELPEGEALAQLRTLEAQAKEALIGESFGEKG